jgi:DNA-binding response OmpR family regulator
MNKTIAIVDDEPDILELVSINLKKAGFTPHTFEDAKGLFAYLKKQKPDLLILDLMLPDMDGMDICKELKKDSNLANIPILMLTARTDVFDRVVGLELGADDYVTKPFSPRELVARVKAILRRGKEIEQDDAVLKVGKTIKIDVKKYETTVNEKKIELTSTEFKILKMLAERKGWVFSRNQILDYLWGNEKIVVDRTVDVHIKNLREKLGEEGGLIKNIRGVGYKIED